MIMNYMNIEDNNSLRGTKETAKNVQKILKQNM